MKILLCAGEAVPFCKTGGLADVAGTLAQKLADAGHDVCVFLPKYRAIRSAALEAGAALPLSVPLGDGSVEAGLRYLQRRGVSWYFVDSPAYFDREGLYGSGGAEHADNAERFAFFSRAVLEGARAAGFRPDVIHAHDWQTGPVCALLKRRYADDPAFSRTTSVFTVHNMAYQGNFPEASLRLLGLGGEEWTAEGFEFHGRASYLKAGLAYADRLTTVSPSYAREIRESPERGFGLEGLLRRRGADLRGVLNGIDAESWDPRSDTALPRRYGPRDAAEGKAACRRELFRECALSGPGDAPLIGVVSRLDWQKGLDLAAAAVEPLLDRARWVVVGQGDPALAESLRELSRRRPGAAVLHEDFDEPFARRLYAASDFFLMPSRFEPCGLGQMIAMRYGAVPVASRTGGLADTVFDEGSGRPANGYLCEPGDGAGLSRALARALEERGSAAWSARSLAGMEGDYSWERSVGEYLEVYREAARR